LPQLDLIFRRVLGEFLERKIGFHGRVLAIRGRFALAVGESLIPFLALFRRGNDLLLARFPFGLDALERGLILRVDGAGLVPREARAEDRAFPE